MLYPNKETSSYRIDLIATLAEHQKAVLVSWALCGRPASHNMQRTC